MKNKGITLIALIITIIVLLILAGVSISLLTGQDSIIGKAQEGKTKYEDVSRNEEETINGLLNMIGEGTSTLALQPGDAGYAVNTTNGIQQVEDGDENTIPVPVGFSYLTGTKSTGFVIKNDEDNNEFVWIPCDLASNNPEAGTIIYQAYDWNEPEYATGFTEYYTSDTITNSNIISGIDTSVGTYKGYYISRYEAGTEIYRTAAGNLTIPISRATGTPKVYAYNYISWTEAITQSEELYNKIDDNVESRLINARGWDTALKFIEQVDSTYPKNGTSKQWDFHKTGNDFFETGKPLGENLNMLNNIYDMGGNMWEWTADQYNSDTNSRAVRACYYRYMPTGVHAPYAAAYCRVQNCDYNDYDCIGFRVVLYL